MINVLATWFFMMLMMMENGSKEERKKLENHMEIKLCDSTFDEKENEKKREPKVTANHL